MYWYAGKSGVHIAGRSQLKDGDSARAGGGSKAATAPTAIESSSKNEERSLCMKRSMAWESCAGEEDGEARGMLVRLTEDRAHKCDDGIYQ